jgi:hypothetical protein
MIDNTMITDVAGWPFGRTISVHDRRRRRSAASSDPSAESLIDTEGGENPHVGRLCQGRH